jgi:alkylhydroperoxidase family enzyme
MSRLNVPSREQSPVASKLLLAAVEKQLRVVPNLFRLLGLSPATLEAYVSFKGALGKTLDVKTRERIALAIAQLNSRDYCLSAYPYLGLNLAKLDETEVRRNRQGHSGDVKADAAVVFARRGRSLAAVGPMSSSRP